MAIDKIIVDENTTHQDFSDKQDEIIDVVNSGTAEELPSFDSEIVFDGEKHIEHDQEADIDYTLGATQPGKTTGNHYRTDAINADAVSSITFPEGLTLRGDALEPSKTNLLQFRYLSWKSGSILDRTTVINQVEDLPTVITPPSVVSVAVQDGADTNLVVTLDKNSSIADLVGLSLLFTVGSALTITTIASGSGTSVFNLSLSGSVQVGDVFDFVYAANNTITNVLDSEEVLAAGSTAVANNVGSLGAEYSIGTAEIGAISGNVMEITMGSLCDFTDATGFTITASGGAVTATGTGGEVNSAKGTIILSRALAGGETITFALSPTNTIYLNATTTPAQEVTAGEAIINNLFGTTIPEAIYTFRNDDITDYSGNGNDGTGTALTFDADTQTGTRSANFGGANQPRISTLLPATSDYSIFMIIKATEEQDNQHLFVPTGSASFENSCFIQQAAELVRAAFATPGGSDVIDSLPMTGRYGIWVPIMVTFNGTTGDGVVYLEDDTPVTDTVALSTPAGTWQFGINQDISTNQYVGNMDVIRVYNSVVSGAEYTSLIASYGF
jgi:hypothetical protein